MPKRLNTPDHLKSEDIPASVSDIVEPHATADLPITIKDINARLAARVIPRTDPVGCTIISILSLISTRARRRHAESCACGSSPFGRCSPFRQDHTPLQGRSGQNIPSRRIFALSNEHRAHFWGIKAAQAGIPISSNPYASPRQRAAWEAGYRRNPDEERLAIPA